MFVCLALSPCLYVESRTEVRTSGSGGKHLSLKSHHASPVISFYETGSHYAAKAGLELEVLRLQPLKYWDFTCVLLHLDLQCLVRVLMCVQVYMYVCLHRGQRITLILFLGSSCFLRHNLPLD